MSKKKGGERDDFLLLPCPFFYLFLNALRPDSSLFFSKQNVITLALYTFNMK